MRALYQDYDAFQRAADYLKLPTEGRDRMTLTCRTVVLILLGALNIMHTKGELSGD